MKHAGNVSWRVAIASAFVAATVAFCGMTGPAAAGRARPAAVGTPMIYFRYQSLSACNVYMNYSFYDDPKFSLRVVDPSRLSAAEVAFVEAFNLQFATMIQSGRGDACHYDGSVGYAAGQSILERCVTQESRMGYGEQGWGRGRLPAPSNCISYRRSSPGELDFLPASLPHPKITLEKWMAAANAGR